MNFTMMYSAVKTFFITFCSIYTYGKILNCCFTPKKYISSFLYSVLLSLVLWYVEIKAYSYTVPALTLAIVMFCFVLFKQNFGSSLCVSIISVGSSYALFAPLVLITLPLSFILLSCNVSKNIAAIIMLLVIGLLQFLILYLFFHTKRFRNGLPGIKNTFLGDIGIFLGSLLILFSSAIFIDNHDIVYWLLISFVFILGVIIWLWWKKTIQTDYINKNNFQQIDILESKLQERDAELERLSKIIHKDNKLLAALELSTRELLTATASEKAQSLLQELNRFSKERSETLHAYESGPAALPETGLFSVDTMIRYLHQRALKHKIEFQLNLEGELAGITDVICEQDLCTIIADLGENAIIATRESEIKNIRLSMERKPDGYALYFYDSGEPFAKEVLENLGKKRYTTHAETGGSGIGLMTTSELVAKYHGAFYITDEEIPEPYTKCVVVKLLIP